LILSETVLTDNSELKLFDSKKFFVLENTVFNEQDIKIVYSHRSSFRFVYISHFIPEKGHLELMNFLTKWESFNFRLSCYGKKFDSSYYAALIALQSDQLLLMDEIRDDEKFEILKNADFFIMPSLNEGQPLVLLEAMMCGVVIIANDVGFVKDMFWPGYPYIYKGNSFSELNRMMQLISTMSEQEFYQMKIDLKNYYFSRFSNQKHKLKLLNIFN
jgi:glycosyltransferase involved in cell wall biosynthesis